MLCTVCDNITLKSLNRPLGYEHKPSFHDLRESAEGGWCSLCSILWHAVTSERARDASLRDERGSDKAEDEPQFLNYPVRLLADGTIYENRKREIDRFKFDASYRKRLEKKSDSFLGTKLYDMYTEKKPSAVLVCSLQPDTFQLGLHLEVRGKAGLYREPPSRNDIVRGDPYAGRRVSSQANSPSCFELIAYWITKCVTEHENCRRAVCPYSWDDYPDYWARSPSHISLSSEDESPDSPNIDDSSQGVDPSQPDTTTDGGMGKPKTDISSEQDVESQRPQKRARHDSPSPEATSEDGSLISMSHFEQDKAQVASNLKQLEEATAAQKSRSEVLTKRSPLSRGVLCRQVHVPERGSNGAIEDGYYKLCHRSEDLGDLRENPRKHSSVELPLEPTPLLPTRYIYVDSDPPQLQLGGPDARGFYVALSHCWGKSKPLITTTESLAQRMKGMPLHEMPKSFRDAVLITRELGLEFLWIDSLCILQNSKEDWEKESAKMSSVYGNAFLTISASAADGCEKGIFQPRGTPPGPPVELRCQDADDWDPIYIDYMPENTVFRDQQSTDSRAWCFQELALSPRVLVYGKEMLGWLCDSHKDVEHGFVEDDYENDDPPFLAPRLKFLPPPNPLKDDWPFSKFHYYTREKERSFGHWASMVNAFSRRKITHESDRLPALSGIANEIHLETGDEYLAGLWRKDLSYQLLWIPDVTCAGESAEWHRPKSYRAPSWSWAAIEGPIRMNLRPSELDKAAGFVTTLPDDVQVLEAKIEPAGHDPYGEIRSAHLKLSTRMWRVVLRPFKNSKYMNPKLWLRPEKGEDQRFIERLWEMHTVEGQRMGRCSIDMPGERNLDVTELWVMKVDSHQSGLLVTKAEAKDAFLRVGTAYTEPEKLNGKLPLFPETEIVEVILL